MRLAGHLEASTLHAALSAVGIDQHHLRPSTLSIANTTQVIPPLPGGPGIWDISVPFDAQAVIFSLRSVHLSEQAGGMSGVTGLATRSSLEASTASLGGTGTLSTSSYNAIYSKAAAALNLSHKIFSSGGLDISLTDAYLTPTGPSTRVFRTQWTNYSPGNRTLNVLGELVILS